MRQRVIPADWLPPAPSGAVQRVVMHWTAGHYLPSPLDKMHYHVLIDGNGRAIRGPRPPGKYLPHVRAFNTGSVGLAICAMAGATGPARLGPAPLTHLQWERACQAAAEILSAYDLLSDPFGARGGVSEKVLLCHSEVERVFGITQRGKWDIDVLPWAPYLTPPEIHRQMRDKASWYAKEQS